MWYKELLTGQIDGLEPLLSLFESKDAFIDYYFSKVIFFKKENVEKQASLILKRINEDEVLPVRYSMKTKEYFYYKNENTHSGTSKKTFKNRKDAQIFISNNDLYHKDTDIKVCIDKDGNYFVRQEIFNAVGYKVSQGAISDIKNYMISHIWDKTENPLFFTSLWNITLIPHFLAFILDKPETDGLIGEIKEISKAICFNLYQPNVLLNREIIKVEEEPYLIKHQVFFENMVKINGVNFIEPNEVKLN